MSLHCQKPTLSLRSKRSSGCTPDSKQHLYLCSWCIKAMMKRSRDPMFSLSGIRCIIPSVTNEEEKKREIEKKKYDIEHSLAYHFSASLWEKQNPGQLFIQKRWFLFFRKAPLGLNHSCPVFLKDISFFLSHSLNLFASYLLTVLIVLFHNSLFLSYTPFISIHLSFLKPSL